VTPDIFNALFEATGATLTFMNAIAVYRAKGYAGITIPAMLFFTSWGGWNLYYYPHMDQWVSFCAGVALFVANISWLSLALYYGNIANRKDW
jgi:hypothetical protein